MNFSPPSFPLPSFLPCLSATAEIVIRLIFFIVRFSAAEVSGASRAISSISRLSCTQNRAEVDVHSGRQLNQPAILMMSSHMSLSIMRAVARPIALARPLQFLQHRVAGVSTTRMARSLNAAPRPHIANKPADASFSWPANFKSWDAPHSHIDFALHFS